MNNVTYFDVEYANSKSKAIWQMGIVCEDFKSREPVFPELDIYVNPEDGFDAHCIAIHGITSSKVENAPAFPQVWKDIEKYFTNAVIIGHNVASSDLDALAKNLCRYNLDIPVLSYICTYELARDFIPRDEVKDYKLSTLCEHFDIDIDSEHNAFDDACACADLFNALAETYDIEVDNYVKPYYPNNTFVYTAYIDAAVLRRTVSEFYGIVRGFSIDRVINQEEIDFIIAWKKKNVQYSNHKEISDIIGIIDRITEDNVVTLEEIAQLQKCMNEYLDDISTNPVTLATQILDGILKGITTDGEITDEECKNLRQWLYDNIYLSGHFPFDKALQTVESILEDSIFTKEEAKTLETIIKNMLDPINALKVDIHSVEGKHVCLSGVFAYGGKPAVAQYITERGGFIDSSVKKTTDYLIIGDSECQAYSNGTYGTKVKTAMQYNEKGCNIQIIKEKDFFANIK